METTKLRRFAQYARRTLMELVKARLQLVLQPGSAARRENAESIKKLEEAIKSRGEAQVIERVAYTWFNRFCALRFMDVNRYTRIGVVSPAEGQFQPEILAEAKMGHIDDETVPETIRQQIFALLEGKSPSHDPQGEAYRLLVVAACNAFHRAMPFLFERIDDYTELLMPDDLLSGNSILAYAREAMTPDACEDVEVIGWLYQFYISEKKDEVFDGLKMNKKITPENIPAATQLFTPHWIVRYLVENSLGRLWLLNRPGSKLVEKMDYYIKPEQAETDFLRIAKPEEIKICDPACGSGHMLTYAFDLLYAIYEEEGYEPAEIPEKILTNNLYGIEIDERAGELAAFALTMKARAKHRRFFNKGVKPNICVLENVQFDGDELKDYMDFVGRDLFTAPLQTTLRQFKEADNFGSLIRPDVTDVDDVLRILESKNVSENLFLSMTHQKVLQALLQADYLSPKYHVVIANPPYMGWVGMNPRMKSWLGKMYPISKADLMTAFMSRSISLSKENGYWAIINLPSWLFLSTFEKLRLQLFDTQWLQSLLQLGRGIFGSDFGSTAFIFKNGKASGREGVYRRLFEEHVQVRDVETIRKLYLDQNYKRFRADQSEFSHIPGCPVAYWLSPSVRSIFENASSLGDVATTRKGMVTASNETFIRTWQEVDNSRSNFTAKSREDAKHSKAKWFPMIMGGYFRRWYGNREYVVNWENDGDVLQTRRHPTEDRVWATNFNLDFIFLPNINCNSITASRLSFRASPGGELFSSTGIGFFPKGDMSELVAFANSNTSEYFLNILTPTVTANPGDIGRLPIIDEGIAQSRNIAIALIELARKGWDSYETSWDFTGPPLLNPDYRHTTLKATYQKLRAHWREMTLEMQRLEEENNRIFIDAYGLQDELTPDVPLNEITLTCNPHYRYGNDKSEDELEALLLADTMRELVSYAVGCMFGRYALDRPGLILANQGETIEDYLMKVPEPSFPADDDNVIPMLEDDWFTDDVAERFRQFLRVAFGEEHYEANLRFVEQALNIKGKRNYTIRDYFLGEFYTDHVKRYKKRPIYWLFSSPKGSFNALIYLHRYRPDTVSVVLQYLRDFRSKLVSERDHQTQVSISSSASQGEKTKALKRIEELNKILVELDDYERDTLYPLATRQIPLDLDDGVKENYAKLGAALKKIPGLDAADE